MITPKAMVGYIDTGLPPHLRAIVENNVTARRVWAYSFWFILLMVAVFIVTLVLFQGRYDWRDRSLHLDPLIGLGIPGWGALSFLLYYGFNWTRGVYFCIPGIIIGGGYFLALISFGFHDVFPGIIFQANFATSLTMLTCYGLAAGGIFERYPHLEEWLIIVGSALMYLIAFFAAQFSGHAFIPHLPQWYVELFNFDFKVFITSLAVIILMSIMCLFHMDTIRKKRAGSKTDDVHLAINTLYIFFILYLAFLFLFAVSRRKK